METLRISSLVLLSYWVIAFSFPTSALAVITNHSGSICRHYNASDWANIFTRYNGVVNAATTDKMVICPLTRNTSISTGAYIFVDITHWYNGTTTCTAYSYSYAGSQLASQTLAWMGSGFHEFTFNLTGAGKSDAWSDYSVLCVIPGEVGHDFSAEVNGIDLSEI